ncbi:hypothetical protein CASFOL_029628 [Castilleja foliolosa]|uniref:Bifunctional inhibitor/plant lipid transfer protein/seed storage helical domain-containing protein n=1 Tax=Castilleja foliolosa TaxID=1961234 RepID=A0ABD3C9U7_9LAMI
MATKMFEILVILILAIFMLCKGSHAQSSSCTSALMSLSPCMNYVTGNTSTPSSSCCSSLANIVQSQPECLCSLVNGGGSSFGLSINQTLAMALPVVCNVQTPSITRCNGGANGPATAPATSPLSSPADGSIEPTDSPTENNVPSNPSESGSKTGPTNNGSTSDVSKVVSSIRLITASALFFAAWTVNCVNF